MIQNHPHRTGPDLRREFVRRLACHGSAFSRVGASGNPGAVHKRSGKVSYAVLSFGGFLGIGDDHYPLPWESLKYDTNLGGYRTGITEKQLQGAPKYRTDNDWNWEDQTRTRGVNDYYGIPPGVVAG